MKRKRIPLMARAVELGVTIALLYAAGLIAFSAINNQNQKPCKPPNNHASPAGLPMKPGRIVESESP